MVPEIIKKSVESAYGSLCNPRYDFVTRVERQRPYDNLMSALEDRFDIGETTDLNDDIAFCYHINQRIEGS